MVDCDVDITNQLGVLSIHFKGIMTSINTVKVDIPVKEHINPEGIWEVGTVQPNDEVILGAFDINKVVSLEGKHPSDISIKGGGGDWYTGPSIQGFIS